MSKCEHKVVRNFAFEIEKLMHNFCPTDRANEFPNFIHLQTEGIIQTQKEAPKDHQKIIQIRSNPKRSSSDEVLNSEGASQAR